MPFPCKFCKEAGVDTSFEKPIELAIHSRSHMDKTNWNKGGRPKKKPKRNYRKHDMVSEQTVQTEEIAQKTIEKPLSDATNINNSAQNIHNATQNMVQTQQQVPDMTNNEEIPNWIKSQMVDPNMQAPQRQPAPQPQQAPQTVNPQDKKEMMEILKVGMGLFSNFMQEKRAARLAAQQQPSVEAQIGSLALQKFITNFATERGKATGKNPKKEIVQETEEENEYVTKSDFAKLLQQMQSNKQNITKEEEKPTNTAKANTEIKQVAEELFDVEQEHKDAVGE